MNTDLYIPSRNDIYLFFEMIRQAVPKRVLDVGLFVQKTGMISRQAMNCEIPADVELTGWNILNHSILPVYETIYNEIKPSTFKPENIYDMIFLFHVNEFIEHSNQITLWDELTLHGRYVIADTSDSEFVSYMTQRFACESIILEQEPYILIHTNA